MSETTHSVSAENHENIGGRDQAYHRAMELLRELELLPADIVNLAQWNIDRQKELDSIELSPGQVNAGVTKDDILFLRRLDESRQEPVPLGERQRLGGV